MIIRTFLTTIVFLLSSAVFSAPVQPGYIDSDLPGGNYQKFCSDCDVNEANQLVCQCPLEATKDNGSSGPLYERTVDLNECTGTVNYASGLLICDNSTDEDRETVRSSEDDDAVVRLDGVIEPDPTGPAYDDITDRTIIDTIETMPSVRNREEDSVDAMTLKPATYPDSAPNEEPTNRGNVVLKPIVPIDDGRTLPEGDYKEYCSNCRIENNRLVCDCNTGSLWSGTIRASTELGLCKKGEGITYRYGTLMCQDRLQRSLYIYKCRSCKIEGNDLTCKCDRTPCQWSQEDRNKDLHINTSTLSNFRYCDSAIVNCNGILRCGKCGVFDYYEEYSRPYEGSQIYSSCPHMPPSLRWLEKMWQGDL